MLITFVYSKYGKILRLRTAIPDSIVVRTSASHAENPGSIPGRGDLFTRAIPRCTQSRYRQTDDHRAEPLVKLRETAESLNY